MAAAADSVKEAVREGGTFQLPKTKELLGKSGLDKEEEEGKATLRFLSKGPRKRKKNDPVDETQGNWETLESTLKDEDGISNDSALFSKRNVENPGDWHEMPEVRMTPELENDLRIIENRQHLDPKRFYKSSGTGRRKGELPTRVQVGTVVVGAHEFYSSRLTKRERRQTIMGEILSDSRAVDYAKSRFKALQVGKQINKRIIDPAARRKRKSNDW